ncbi:MULTISPECIES: hypothetical protein [unclassified Burkholderia]|uniref:hypothetical protein n=1 Tax=unclassified Burkholderia TaxID=2613784 RepID=UPI0015C64A6E|nr:MULTISPECIES: hypothetical protein [unclassified Burkholderia]MDN7429926.1 hypothetical protein [Burkholderia sp. AU45388]
MFATHQANALPLYSAIAGDQFSVWSIVDIWGGNDALVLQLSEGDQRGSPRKVALVDLKDCAAVIQQCVSDGFVVRGAAILRLSAARSSKMWRLEPLREIRTGVVPPTEQKNRNVLQRLTIALITEDGSRHYLPMEAGSTTYPEHGRRVYRRAAESKGISGGADS